MGRSAGRARTPAASLHAHAARCSPRCRHETGATATVQRRGAELDQSTLRMRVPPPLPPRGGARCARASPSRGGRSGLGRLPRGGEVRTLVGGQKARALRTIRVGKIVYARRAHAPARQTICPPYAVGSV